MMKANQLNTRITIAAASAAVLLTIGVTQALDGRFAPTKTSPPPAPRSADTASPELSVPVELPEGGAEADDNAADATTQVVSQAPRSQDGAVEAFVTYATWAIASPAAEEDPVGVGDALGEQLNPDDSMMLQSIDRSGGVDFTPSNGAYRVIAISGPANSPTNVMLEVIAPMRDSTGSTWVKVGGVVTWVANEWQVTSLQPNPVPQPSTDSNSIALMPPEEQASLLEGLGWLLFANGSESQP